MELSELRIGNWFTIGGSKPLHLDMKLLYSISSGMRNYQNLEPIELTVEWLIKLGFDIYEDMGQINIGEFDTISWFIEEGISFNVYGSEEAHLKHIKHVHQVQNLYHALTGEELQTK